MVRSAYEEDPSILDQWQPESAVSFGDIGNNGAPIIDDAPAGVDIGQPSAQPMATPGVVDAPTAPRPAETVDLPPYQPSPADIPGPPVGQPPAPVAPPVPAMEPVGFKPSTVETDSIPKPDMPKDARLKVTQTVQSPEQNAVNADAAKLADAKAAAERNASAQRTSDLQAQEKAAAAQVTQQMEKKRQTEALLKDHDERLAAATARNEQALADYKGQKFHDFWSDKTIGDRIIGALAGFLGGLGTAFGGENTAMKNLNSIIQRDYDRQKDEIAQKFTVYGETSKNLERAQALKEHAINDLNLRFSAATEATAAQLAQMKLKQAIPAEQVQRDKNVLEIYEKANTFKQQSAKDTNAMVEWDTYNKAKTGGGPGRLDVAAELVKMAEGGASRSQIVTRAAELKLPEKVWKNQVDLAFSEREKGAAAGEKADAAKDARTLYHPETGKPIALMPTARTVDVQGKKLESAIAYAKVLQQVADHIEKEGRVAPSVLGMSTEANRERMNLMRDAQAKGRTFSEINATDSGAHLEHEMLGGAGAGLETMASPKVLREFAKGVMERAEHRVRAVGTPIDGKPVALSGEGSGTAPPPGRQGPPPEPDRGSKAAAANRVIQDKSAPPAVRKRAKEYLQSLGR